jgi:ribonuclease HI
MRLQALHRWLGVATNNEAEYHALIEGLKAAKKWNPDRLEVYLDSKLVVEQVKGKYKTKKPELQQLNVEVARLLGEFPEVEFKHVLRGENRGADHLANMAIDAHVKKPKFGG